MTTPSQSYSRRITTNAIIATLYIVLTLINPISAGMFQFRVSTLLVPSGFINPKLAPGIIIGVIISNLWSPLGFLDVIGGAMIQLVTFYVFRRLSQSAYMCSTLYGIWCGIVVAAVLHFSIGAPYWVSVFSVGISNLVFAYIGSYICENYLRSHIEKMG